MSRILQILLALMLALFVYNAAVAGSATATWMNPTSYVDGTVMGIGDITQTRLEYGSCVGTSFGTKSGEVVASGTATTATVSNLAAGTYCFRAYTKAKGVESAPSNVASKVVPQTAPNPPTLMTVDTVAYSITVDYQNLAIVKNTAVGKVPLGVACSAANTDDGYHMVPRTAVAWAGANRPTYVVAKCG
jgi:hypothetical protein